MTIIDELREAYRSKMAGQRMMADLTPLKHRDYPTLESRAADEIEKLRTALKKAKPIVGAACAAAGGDNNNDARRMREKVYEEIVAVLSGAD